MTLDVSKSSQSTTPSRRAPTHRPAGRGRSQWVDPLKQKQSPAKYSRFCRTMALLAVVAFVVWAMTPFYALAFNMTTSLPGTLYFIDKTQRAPRRGDTIAFSWHGGATYPAGVMFTKHVAGIPGDVIRLDGRNVWVNQTYIGFAKAYSLAHVPLSPVTGGVIPEGEYFVASPNPNSLDSRYSLAGNVRQDTIIGRAYAIF